jgi:hypothetical protein
MYCAAGFDIDWRQIQGIANYALFRAERLLLPFAASCLPSLAACQTTPAPAPSPRHASFRALRHQPHRYRREFARYALWHQIRPLSLGMAQVSIPEDHAIGETRRGASLLPGASPIRARYVVLLSVESLDADGFLRALTDRAALR